MSIQDRMRHIYESQIHQLGGTLVGGRSKKFHHAVKSHNPWIRHLQEFRYAHPDLSYKEAMQLAKNSYNKPAAHAAGKRAAMKHLMKGKGAYMSEDIEMLGGRVKKTKKAVKKPAKAVKKPAKVVKKPAKHAIPSASELKKHKKDQLVKMLRSALKHK